MAERTKATQGCLGGNRVSSRQTHRVFYTDQAGLESETHGNPHYKEEADQDGGWNGKEPGREVLGRRVGGAGEVQSGEDSWLPVLQDLLPALRAS